MRGETVTRLRDIPGGYDPYGDQLPGTVDALDIDGCAVAPRTTALHGEVHDYARDGLIVGWQVFAPIGSDVVRTDRMRVRGEECDVDGQPAAWHSPYSRRRPGLVIQLRRTEG